MKILVTGGAGYIGSHIVLELIAAGHNPIIADNFSNSNPGVIARLETIAGRRIALNEVDVADVLALESLVKATKPEAVIHLAGYKAVGESVADPLMYYRNNLGSTIAVCEVMRRQGVRNLVFSSSATVYGMPETMPISEDAKLGALNPYGQTKLMGEVIVSDEAAARPDMSAVILRYFNPAGAHESGLIGEDPSGIPNNLMPYVAQVAIGRRDQLTVHGGDYDTPDGTGVRDYIHVVDLAKAHVAAVEAAAGRTGVRTYNIGTGVGYSVLEIVKAFGEAAGKTIPYAIGPRRPGDVAICYADPTLARDELGWKAEKSLEQMCADHWRWQHANPQGYSVS